MSLRALMLCAQLLRRVYVEGGGSNAFANCAVGETTIPVENADWYQAAGGVVVSGPQRLTYTGRSLGGGGSLVGPGAAPSGAPVVAAAGGAGVDTGAHSYAVTFLVGAGESIAGPLAAITVGLVPAPASAPTAAAPTIGSGPDTGSHDYAVTFVTAAGETTAGPSLTKATGETPEPATAPTPGTPTTVIASPGAPTDNGASNGGSLTAGVYKYAITFVTASYETAPGPTMTVNIGAQHLEHLVFIPTGPAGTTSRNIYRTVVNGAQLKLAATLADNTTTAYNDGLADGSLGADAPTSAAVDVGLHDYAVTFVTSIGETTPGPISGSVNSGTHIANPTVAAGITGASGGTSPFISGTAAPTGWAYTWVTAAGETLPSPTCLPAGYISSGLWIASGPYWTALNTIPTGPTGTIARNIYRTTGGGSQLKYVGTIADNTTAYFEDRIADGALGANAPTASTALVAGQVPLTAIPLGDANVTSRKIYRRSGGAGLKLLTTIANNTATTYTDSTANASLGAAVPSVTTATLNRIALAAIPTSPLAIVTSRKLYRTAAGGAQLKLLATLGDNTTTTYADTTTDAGLGANVPVTNTATANQVALSNIPIGAATVTSRKLYRTPAAGSQLKLLATLADNTTTIYADAVADGSLGANVPTSDTSGLTQPAGQVLAGAVTLLVAGTGAFSSSGGWAVIGNGQQVIRYTGITGSTLTGIPASGAGSIVASIGYNSTVTAAPMLSGIPASGAGSILWPILKGDPVNLFVQVDDVAAQAALAALIGGDGIQEESLQDRRLSFREATTRGESYLAARNAVHVEIRFTTRDINTRAGATIAVNLGPPFNIVGNFTIQHVTTSGFSPALNPLREAVATATLYLTFDDLMKHVAGRLG